MARPVCNRIVNALPAVSYFKPQGIPMRDLEIVQLTVDELEAVRLADMEGMYQETAASEMQVSRQTFGRIIESAHRKIAEALVEGKSLRIDGGQYLVKGRRTFTCKRCRRRYQNHGPRSRSTACPRCEDAACGTPQSDPGKEVQDE